MKKGITLVEILVAIVIFSVVALGSMVFFSVGRKYSRRGEVIEYANILAEDVAQNAKGRPYEDITGSYTSPQTIIRYGATYQRWYGSRWVHYDPIPGVRDSGEDYKIISITVTWTTDTGASDTVTLYTVISPRDHGND